MNLLKIKLVCLLIKKIKWDHKLQFLKHFPYFKFFWFYILLNAQIYNNAYKNPFKLYNYNYITAANLRVTLIQCSQK